MRTPTITQPIRVAHATLEDVIAAFMAKVHRFDGMQLPPHGTLSFEVTLRDGRLHRPTLSISDSDDQIPR